MVGLVVKVVQNSTGKPVRGKYVSVGCDELFALWNTSKVYTGSDGIAQFSVQRVGFKGKIYIDGKPVFEGKVMASNTVYI